MSDRPESQSPSASTAPETDATPAPPPNDAERRAALAKLGALAAWTTPAMLTLLTSARAQDFGSPCLPPGPCT
jgi:hypothetical protein